MKERTYPGTVTRIIDGDTLEIKVGLWSGLDLTTHVRLFGINAPELREEKGHAAREKLSSLCLGKSVALKVKGRDKYGRTLGSVEVEGLDAAQSLLADGLAVPYFCSLPEVQD